MIVLLTGENEFAILHEQKRLTEQYLGSHESLGLESLDADDIEPSRLRDALLQLPFLVNKKLVIISNAYASKLIIDLLVELLPLIPDDIDVVLIDPKADKRTKLYKELAVRSSVKEFSSLKGSALEKWAVEYASQQGSAISSSNARILINRIGIDQMRLAREIEKLSFTHNITEADIMSLTDQSIDASVFDLLDKTFSGKKEDALRLYDELLSGRTDPNEILSLIAWQLHVLALVKHAGEGSAPEIASKTGLHPYVVGKAVYVARALSNAQIKNGVDLALQTDIQIKTSATDPADAVKVLLLQLSQI